jgi:arylsulfatase A-like enzyme
MKTSFKLFIAISVLLMGQISWAQKSEQPNVLWIIVDDWSYHDTSLNGSKLYETPQVDALAEEGFVFDNAYASYPRCVPSRYAMMSGSYPLDEDHGALGSLPKNQNFIKTFDEAGYFSFYVGKWHLGSEENSPIGMGFKASFAAGEAGGTDTHFYPFNKNREFGVKGEKAAIEDIQDYGKEGEFLSDVLTNRTIDYIKENKGKPFMGVLAFYAVHTPIEAKPNDIERNRKQLLSMGMNEEPVYIPEGNGVTRMSQNDVTYAGLVENTDENIGRLIQMLKVEGLYENTIIVLTSDHGGLSTRGNNNRHIPTSNAPHRAGKGWLYEGGIKVPMIFKIPDTKAGKDTESIVLGMDVSTTLTDLVFNKPLENTDGKSLKKLIQGKENWKDRTVYWNSYKARPNQTGDNKTSVIRIGDYKLLQFVETGKVELYNVVEDIAEKNDLSVQMPEKTKSMLEQLEQFKSDRNISMKANHKTIPNGTGDPMIDQTKTNVENPSTIDPKEQKKIDKKAAKKAAKKAERKARK